MAVIQGKRIIYLYRVLKDAKTDDAKAIAFTSENSRSKSGDSDTVVTKDGVIRVPKDVETEISTTAIFASENDEIITKLENAIDNGEKVEIWEVNLDKPGTETEDEGKYAAKYFHGYVTSFELTSNSEDHAEASMDFAVEGKGVDGYATVSDDQKAVADLVFKDTTKETVETQSEEPVETQSEEVVQEEPGAME